MNKLYDHCFTINEKSYNHKLPFLIIIYIFFYLKITHFTTIFINFKLIDSLTELIF